MPLAAPAPARSAAWIIAADIKLAHSVFALPFALLAAFMAAAPQGGSPPWRRFAGQLALVVAAMVLARTVAMLANRLLDRHIDAANPRTAGRALPSGRLTPAAALAALLGGAALFMLACAGFGLLWGNWWPAVLGAPVLAWLAAYGLLKRFTALCHAYLGASLAISPPAAALAVDPAALAAQPAILLLAGMVLAWVAGFDIIYALQDLEVDRAQGLHSLPARLGPRRAILLSRALHGAALLALGGALVVDRRLGPVFAAAVAAVALLLLYEHVTLRAWSARAGAVFTVNGIISLLLGGAGVADLLRVG
jgi:4-hydroxybenzoate polyprenyltransferase